MIPTDTTPHLSERERLRNQIFTCLQIFMETMSDYWRNRWLDALRQLIQYDDYPWHQFGITEKGRKIIDNEKEAKIESEMLAEGYETPMQIRANLGI